MENFASQREAFVSGLLPSLSPQPQGSSQRRPPGSWSPGTEGTEKSLLQALQSGSLGGGPGVSIF